MNETTFVLCDYDVDRNSYSLYNLETENLVEEFKLEKYDYEELKSRVVNSAIIQDSIKNELIKDWKYATETKLERNGCYFFKV